MKIYYEDPAFRHIQVDRVALTSFLREQGMSDPDIQRLCIRFRDRMPEGYSRSVPAEKVLGSYNNRSSVYVCTKNRMNKVLFLNRTLLHELRHYMKKGYQPGETKLPYWNRPSEVDARAFAEQYYKTHLFLSLVGVPAVLISEPLDPPPLPITSVASSDKPPTLFVLVIATALLLLNVLRKRGGHS